MVVALFIHKSPEDIEKLKSYAHHREYDLNSISLEEIKEKIRKKLVFII